MKQQAYPYLTAFRGSSKNIWATTANTSQQAAIMNPAAVMGLTRTPWYTPSGSCCRGKEMRGPAAIPMALEHTKAAQSGWHAQRDARQIVSHLFLPLIISRSDCIDLSARFQITAMPMALEHTIAAQPDRLRLHCRGFLCWQGKMPNREQRLPKH